jgi:hypothetical protein
VTDDEFEKLCHDAADLLEQRGWCQGKIEIWEKGVGPGNGRLCLAGAMSTLLNNGNAWLLLGKEVHDRLRKRIDPLASMTVSAFNDSRDSVDEVLAMLRNDNWKGLSHPSIRKLRGIE